LKTVLDFEPDSGASMMLVNSGTVMELLDTKHQRWPGYNLPADTPYQFVEGEYMQPEEYDHLLNDPSDFIFRVYLPRIFGTLAPVAKLPPFRDYLGGMGFSGLLTILLTPEYQELGKKLVKAAKIQEKIAKEGMEFSRVMLMLGYPSNYGSRVFGGGVGSAPFDAISDNLRGMRGAMIDMYRCPDKLLAACDKILDWQLAKAIPAELNLRGYRPQAGMPLHRGSQGFMSKKQFEKFYWPTLKKAIIANVNLGYISAPFWEGIWDDRLEYLLEFPKGSILVRLDRTDIFKAKEILKDHLCIEGNVPCSLLQIGSVPEVQDYCRKLIDVVGKGGGYILGPRSSTDEVKPENLKAMIEFTKEYGRY